MKLFKKLGLSFFLTLVTFGTLYSQNESGTRHLDTTIGKLGFYPSSYTLLFHHSYPIIKDIPPLNTSMPLEVIMGYIFVDSLARHMQRNEMMSRMKSWNTLNDTLKSIAKFYYKMMDYNPCILHQYSKETELNQSLRYKTDVITLRNETEFEYCRLSPDSLKNIFRTLITSENILRVKVVAIDSMKPPQPAYGDTNSFEFFAGTCQVLDTIKGRVFPSITNNQPIFKNKKYRMQSFITDANTTYMYFQYEDVTTPQNFRSDNSIPYLFQKSDPRLTKYNGGFGLQIGQEIIVFLTRGSRLMDEHNDYYILSPNYYCSNAALPIVNGIVYDVNKIWSDAETLSYQDWLEKFNYYKNLLLGEQ